MLLFRKKTFDQIELFKKYVDILLDKDQYLEEFKIYSNLCRNIYEACKPEIFEFNWKNEYMPVIFYLEDMIKVSVRDESIDNAKIVLGRTLDLSIQSKYVTEDVNGNEFAITKMQTLNLSDIKRMTLEKQLKKSV